VKTKGGGSASATVEAPATPATGDGSDGGGFLGGAAGIKAKTEILKQGKRLMGRHKRSFGRIQKKYQRQFDRMVDGKIKGMLPKFK